MFLGRGLFSCGSRELARSGCSIRGRDCRFSIRLGRDGSSSAGTFGRNCVSSAGTLARGFWAGFAKGLARAGRLAGLLIAGLIGVGRTGAASLELRLSGFSIGLFDGRFSSGSSTGKKPDGCAGTLRVGRGDCVLMLCFKEPTSCRKPWISCLVFAIPEEAL